MSATGSIFRRGFRPFRTADRLLVEHFLEQRFYRTVFYTFAGRRANQTLGMLITRRMEHLGLKPLSFQITDYGLVVSGVSPVSREHIAQFLAPDILGDELEEWILDSPHAQALIPTCRDRDRASWSSRTTPRARPCAR